MTAPSLSRRQFLALTGTALPAALSAQTALNSAMALAAAPAAASSGGQTYPIGLELYSVREELANGNDQLNVAALTAVAKMGYKIVEFWAPYYDTWTYPQAKEGRKLLDDLGLVCHSIHNHLDYFSDAKIAKAIELNQIMGTKYLVAATAGNAKTVDDWKKVGDTLAATAEKLKPHGLCTGFHNHDTEWAALPGTTQRAMDVLAASTPKEVMLQLDVGTCVMAGADPVAWIKANPGRINTVHCKEWGKANGFGAIFGEGDAPWKEIFAAAENGGGVEYYLIEQEQSPRGQELPTVARCLANYKKMRG
jgi:sugar phosphate isomerase/epimerase